MILKGKYIRWICWLVIDTANGVVSFKTCPENKMFSFFQLINRILIMFMPGKYQPDYMYLRYVPIKRVHIFTCLQVLCLAILWTIKTIKSISIAFPLMVSAISVCKFNPLLKSQICKSCIIIGTKSHWYSFESAQRELSNEYQCGRVWRKLSSLW